MLENDTIRLRALEISDADRLFIWENNPENWRVSHTITPFSRHILIDYINSVTDIFADKQLRLMLETKADKTPIGTVDLFDCDFKNKRAGIGILIADKENRRKGYATQVLEILLPYAFKSLSMHQIYCNILTDNTESISLFKKFGFEEAGLKKDWVFSNGAYFDELLLQKINPYG